MTIRPVLDFFILCSRHPLYTTAVLLGLWLLYRRFRPRSETVGTDEQVWLRLRPVLILGSLTIFTAFLLNCLWYLFHAGYTSDVEAMIASVSWWVKSGGELYHTPAAAQQYSVLYGPGVYLATAFYLDLLGPTVMASKFGALLALYGSLTMLFLTLRRWVSNSLAFGMTTVTVLLYWNCGSAAMLVRPDAYLLAAVCLGLYSAGSPRIVLAVLGAALGLGLAVNQKLHAVLYLLPILTVLDEQHGWRATLSALGLAGLVILLPFVLHDGISFKHYYDWLFITAHHGLELADFPHLMSRAIFYAIPVLVPLLAHRTPANRAGVRRHFIFSWIIGNLVVVLLAMKPGAGQVHLMPLIPVNMVFAARLWPDEGIRGLVIPELRTSRQNGIVAAFIMSALLSGVVSGYRSARLASSLMRDAPGITEDIERILATYPDREIGMGYGGDYQFFHWTNQRVLLTFAGEPLLIDIISLMDSRRADKPISEATFDLINSGTVDLWLVPKGQEPFLISNWYPPHEPIFPADFRERFTASHRLEGETEYFDLWGWDRTAHLDAIRVETGFTNAD
jgi:hypothetical protein